MNLTIQIILVCIAALLAGLNALIVYILSDLKVWVKTLNARFDAHIADRFIHK